MDYARIDFRLYEMVVAFMRTMANACSSCVRRGLACRECDLVRAPEILRGLEESATTDHMSCDPFVRRCVDALACIRTNDAPICAADIEVLERCSRTAKYKALRHLLTTGIVRQFRDEDGVRFFEIAPGQERAADEVIGRGEI